MLPILIREGTGIDKRTGTIFPAESNGLCHVDKLSHLNTENRPALWCGLNQSSHHTTVGETVKEKVRLLLRPALLLGEQP